MRSRWMEEKNGRDGVPADEPPYAALLHRRDWKNRCGKNYLKSTRSHGEKFHEDRDGDGVGHPPSSAFAIIVYHAAPRLIFFPYRCFVVNRMAGLAFDDRGFRAPSANCSWWIFSSQDPQTRFSVHDLPRRVSKIGRKFKCRRFERRDTT